MISFLFLAAAFQFANVCSDDMVLQRDVAAPVWGFGEKGKTVEVALNGKIVGETIVLSHPKVTDAFSFRYAWFDLPQGWNVVNGADLPLGTCRG